MTHKYVNHTITFTWERLIVVTFIICVCALVAYKLFFVKGNDNEVSPQQENMLDFDALKNKRNKRNDIEYDGRNMDHPKRMNNTDDMAVIALDFGYGKHSVANLEGKDDEHVLPSFAQS